jgi:acetyl-CoA synthetase (ADP-forming)
VESELYRLFYPRGIAVVGASKNPSKIGHIVLKNILDGGYKGRVYPVNPTAESVLGLPCYPSVSSINGEVDVVIVSVPADKTIEVAEDAGRAGAQFLVVLSSGLKEVGNKELEERLVQVARKNGMRVLGSNIFGYVSTPAKLNALLRLRSVDCTAGKDYFHEEVLELSTSRKLGPTEFLSARSPNNHLDFLD